MKLIIPDPSMLLSALDTINDSLIKKDGRKTFLIESAREIKKVDAVTTQKQSINFP